MGLLEFIIFVAIIFNFSLGLFVFARDPSKKLNRFFWSFLFFSFALDFCQSYDGNPGDSFLAKKRFCSWGFITFYSFIMDFGALRKKNNQLSINYKWKVINGIAFVLFCIFGYFLIRATFREIKRKKEAERIAFQERKLRIEAEKLAEETERLSRAKDQFLLSIQHHLRTLFNPIRGYISMILEGTYIMVLY